MRFSAQGASSFDSPGHRPGFSHPLKVEAQRAGRSFVEQVQYPRTAGPLGLDGSLFAVSRADGPGYWNCWPFGPILAKLPNRHGFPRRGEFTALAGGAAGFS